MSVRPPNKLLTLLFVLRSEPSSQVLLGFKKRGFGEDRWNGFGGKVQPGESISDAAVRLDYRPIVGRRVCMLVRVCIFKGRQKRSVDLM